MIAYILRRVLYAIPILIGVNLLTFTLFFVVNTPDDMARMQLGIKRVTPEAIDKWKQQHGYDKPLLLNTRGKGAGKLTGDRDLEAEGQVDQAEGTIRDKAGKAIHGAADAAERLGDKLKGRG